MEKKSLWHNNDNKISSAVYDISYFYNKEF